MPLQSFKLNSVKRKLNAERRKNRATNRFLERKINSVLVFCACNDSEQIKGELGQFFDLSQQDIVSISICDASNHSKEDCISMSSFSLLGKLKGNLFKDVLEKKFDLLINFVENDVLMNYVTSISASKFKVGKANNDDALFDLMIDTKAIDRSEFYKELKRYLTILITK